jgi:hypothetical protein
MWSWSIVPTLTVTFPRLGFWCLLSRVIVSAQSGCQRPLYRSHKREGQKGSKARRNINKAMWEVFSIYEKARDMFHLCKKVSTMNRATGFIDSFLRDYSRSPAGLFQWSNTWPWDTILSLSNRGEYVLQSRRLRGIHGIVLLRPAWFSWCTEAMVGLSRVTECGKNLDGAVRAEC